MMNHSIDLNVHRYLGNRKDGFTIDARKYYRGLFTAQS